MSFAAAWSPWALILTLCLSACATAPFSPPPPPTRLLRACPEVSPLSVAFRADLSAALAQSETALSPEAFAALRLALAEWGALRDRARLCAA